MALFYVTINLEVPTFEETGDVGKPEHAESDIAQAFRELARDKEWQIVSHSISPV